MTREGGDDEGKLQETGLSNRSPSPCSWLKEDKQGKTDMRVLLPQSTLPRYFKNCVLHPYEGKNEFRVRMGRKGSWFEGDTAEPSMPRVRRREA